MASRLSKRIFDAAHACVIAAYLALAAYGVWLRPPDTDWSGIDLILLAAPWTLFARIFGDQAMWYAIPVGVLLNTLLLYRFGRAIGPSREP